MLQRLREKRQDEGGFTLIELLVVVLIIAILAAIAIPVFLRQREKAYAADVQSTLRNAATAAESWATENGGDYTGLAASSDFTDVRHPTTQVLTVAAANATGYCINITESRLTGKTYGVGRFLSTVGKPESVVCP
jgi:type IV pilus assembly protein PilA